MKRPVIAISGNYMFDLAGKFKSQKKAYVNDDYAQAVIKGGGIPFIMPISQNEEVIKAQLENVDALIVSGGSDVNPLLYGEDQLAKCGEIMPERDNFDMMMLKIAFQKKIPIFGICRGIQLINVFCGGTLYQDLSYSENTRLKHSQDSLPHISVHKVNIMKNTLLEKFTGKDELLVNSFHHQSIKEIAEGFHISAISSDGIIEGIEKTDKDHLVIAVQWHPEPMAAMNDQDMIKIFEGFIKRI